jgi:AcrR family transcriptional regulator
MGDDSPCGGGPFAGDPADTREAILRATFRVLQEHGFAGLSIQRIVDEADLSKSSIYHFFEDKDDLMLSALDAMLEWFGPPLEDDVWENPEEALWAHLDFALQGVGGEGLPPVERPATDDADRASGRPYVELRSQAVHDETYRERFTDIDASLRDRLASIVRAGIDRGDFSEVDPEATAEFFLTVMLGGLFRRSTTDGFDVEPVRDELERVVESRLLADG